METLNGKYLATAWDMWILQSIILSFIITSIDATSKSFTLAFFVLFFDVNFLTDSLARGLRKAMEICQGVRKIHIGTYRGGSVLTSVVFTLSNWLRVFGCVALIPFHVLLLFSIERGVFYQTVCIMRLMWLYQARRSFFAFINLDGLMTRKRRTRRVRF